MNNEPAFPLHNHGTQSLGLHFTGMTLRDYFAAKAMQAFISSSNLQVFEDARIAKAAYKIADAMMEARK